MTGWLILGGLMLAAIGGLWLMRVRGSALTAAVAALLFGAAGYAWQGNPAFYGVSAASEPPALRVPLSDARHAFFDRFTRAESWLTMAEALERTGKVGDSAGLLQNAVRRYPRDPQLWIGLGNALVAQAGALTPPAEFAFKRAQALDPTHPAAPFFYGLARARSGDPQSAVAIWNDILATAPADASWRPLVEQGVAAVGPAANAQAATGS